MKKILLLSLLILLSACGNMSKTIYTFDNVGLVSDIENIPQNLYTFTSNLPKDNLLSANEQNKEWQKYQARFFSVFSAKPSIKKTEIERLFNNNGYAENLLPITNKQKENLQKNANLDSFPNQRKIGILIRNSDVRELPTMRPRFNDPKKAGEGFPFDMLQYFNLAISTPLLITHESLDKAWLFIETSAISGWVQAQNVAELSKNQVEEYKKMQLYAVIEDNSTFYDKSSGAFLAKANIGAILAKKNNDIVLVQKTNSGQAIFVPVQTNNFISTMPLELSADNIAMLGNQMLGQAYGWGSSFENRDCSSMLMDLFTPFGVWLPRNSRMQANAWEHYSIADLTAQNKEHTILKNAKPFRTLIYMPGHITLYIGEYDNQALIFHNMWGIRTKSNDQDGRYIIGRAVITSLSVGKELDNSADKTGFLKRITSYSVLE